MEPDLIIKDNVYKHKFSVLQQKIKEETNVDILLGKQQKKKVLIWHASTVTNCKKIYEEVLGIDDIQ